MTQREGELLQSVARKPVFIQPECISIGWKSNSVAPTKRYSEQDDSFPTNRHDFANKSRTQPGG
jgi:hypothetical protein